MRPARSIRVLSLALGLALLSLMPAAPCRGQAPDRRGELTLERPDYRGVHANAPIDTRYHLRNEGGSDRAGLCVPTSIVINGAYQGVPGLELGKGSLLWRTAKGRPGGYGPDKLAHLVEQTMPDEKYASYVGTDPAILERLSAKGYPIGATMNTGALYGYMPIHHMISLAHYSKKDGLACVVDNNDPGKYHWMPAAEFDRRWIDGGTGWAWIWTRIPKAPGHGFALPVMVLAVATLLTIGGHRARDAIPNPGLPSETYDDAP